MNWIGVFPAITADTMTVLFNFGGSDMKFGPPDESFRKFKEVAVSDPSLVE